jgi:hypothetical protein
MGCAWRPNPGHLLLDTSRSGASAGGAAAAIGPSKPVDWILAAQYLARMTRHPDPLGVSIRLYLADGRADGFRLVEKSNWTGLGLVSSRSDYPRARKREEYSRPGVYLLTGPASGSGLKDQLYIGEADDVRERVDQHLKNKDFWTAVVAFTSKDENLNKAHVRYLEARLVQLASKAGRVKLLNGTGASTSQVV